MTKQSTPDICFLNHRHIVRSVSDRQRHRVPALLHELDGQCFLGGRNTATDDSFALCAEVEEERLEFSVQGVAEGVPVDDDGEGGFRVGEETALVRVPGGRAEDGGYFVEACFDLSTCAVDRVGR